MNDPRERAAAHPPPTLGEGCVRRYDPEALSPESGSDFAGAAALWQRIQRQAGGAPAELPEPGAAAPNERPGAGRD